MKLRGKMTRLRTFKECECGALYMLAGRCPRCHPVSNWWRAADVVIFLAIIGGVRSL